MPYVPADERRRQLVDAASRVIREVGLERATTRLIAEAAGASLPSLHYAFADKDALLAAVGEHWLQLATDLLHRLVPPGCETAEAVGNLMHGFYDWVAAEPDLGLAQYELLLWAVRHRADTDLARRFHTAYRSACREALARTLRPDHRVDRELDEVTGTMATALDGCLIRVLASGDGPAAWTDLERFTTIAIRQRQTLGHGKNSVLQPVDDPAPMAAPSQARARVGRRGGVRWLLTRWGSVGPRGASSTSAHCYCVRVSRWRWVMPKAMFGD